MESREIAEFRSPLDRNVKRGSASSTCIPSLVQPRQGTTGMSRQSRDRCQYIEGLGYGIMTVLAFACERSCFGLSWYVFR